MSPAAWDGVFVEICPEGTSFVAWAPRGAARRHKLAATPNKRDGHGGMGFERSRLCRLIAVFWVVSGEKGNGGKNGQPRRNRRSGSAGHHCDVTRTTVHTRHGRSGSSDTRRRSGRQRVSAGRCWDSGVPADLCELPLHRTTVCVASRLSRLWLHEPRHLPRKTLGIPFRRAWLRVRRVEDLSPRRIH